MTRRKSTDTSTPSSSQDGTLDIDRTVRVFEAFDVTPPECIVKFREGGTIREVQGRLVSQGLSLDHLHDVVASMPGTTVGQSFPDHNEVWEQLRSSAQLALEHQDLPSLDLFLRVRRPTASAQDMQHLADLINQDPQVEYAVVSETSGPPPAVFTQAYLGTRANSGLDINFAHQRPGGTGSGVTICDCEYDFNDQHPDLPQITRIAGVAGAASPYSNHGTAVVGVLAAKNQTPADGVKGISHGATVLFSSESGQRTRTEAIGDAVARLKSVGVPGILLLEMQTGKLMPVEVNRDIFALVQQAAGAGIAVIEAAGNGGVLLDKVISGTTVVWDASTNDSGAILVGAGDPTNGFKPIAVGAARKTNFGPRVDCQGWGVGVVTTRDPAHPTGLGDVAPPVGADAAFTAGFGGTSSAAAMVAGLVACLLGVARQRGVTLTPSEVRQFLRVGAPSPSDIGPFPDLRAILGARFPGI